MKYVMHERSALRDDERPSGQSEGIQELLAWVVLLLTISGFFYLEVQVQQDVPGVTGMLVAMGLVVVEVLVLAGLSSKL